jgi:hypothetical protein
MIHLFSFGGFVGSPQVLRVTSKFHQVAYQRLLMALRRGVSADRVGASTRCCFESRTPRLRLRVGEILF